MRILQNDSFKLKKEALFAICNVINGGTDQQVTYLVLKGVMEELSYFVVKDGTLDIQVMLAALGGIDDILKVGGRDTNGTNKFAKEIDKVYLDNLKNDRTVPYVVWKKVSSILKEHFGDNDDEFNWEWPKQG